MGTFLGLLELCGLKTQNTLISEREVFLLISVTQSRSFNHPQHKPTTSILFGHDMELRLTVGSLSWFCPMIITVKFIQTIQIPMVAI